MQEFGHQRRRQRRRLGQRWQQWRQAMESQAPAPPKIGPQQPHQPQLALTSLPPHRFQVEVAQRRRGRTPNLIHLRRSRVYWRSL